MRARGGSEADRAYLRRVAEDCAGLLGPGIEIGEIELETDGEFVLRLGYRLQGAEWTSEGHGETVVAAHGALREELVLDRIRLGIRVLVRQGS